MARLAHGLSERRADWALTALFLLPTVLLLGALFAYPLAVTLARSFTEPSLGLGNYRWFLSGDANLGIFGRTFSTAFLVTAITLVLGFAYAYVMVKASPRVRMVLLLAVLVPLWTSTMARTFAWVILLQQNGAANWALDPLGLGLGDVLGTTTAVVIGMVQILLPFVVLPIYASMSAIDQRLLTAAESLGARPSVAFWKVFVPLALPGTFAGAVIVFVASLGFFITPVFLGSPDNALISVAIQSQLNLLEWGRASAMGGVLLCTTLLLLGLAYLAVRRGGVMVKLPVGR